MSSAGSGSASPTASDASGVTVTPAGPKKSAKEIHPDDIALPGQDEDKPKKDKSLNKWHNFESQYSLALEQSAIIEREAWGSQIEFLMSCIASAVGLGNIWRFPFVAGANGGGAFLIPYAVILCFVGRPLYMLELGMGQFTSSGPVKMWECVPAFRGVGYAATAASFCVSTFYCVIMGWAILYFIYSMHGTFPWERRFSQFPNMDPVFVDKSQGAFFGLQHLGLPPMPENKTNFYNMHGLDGPPLLHITLALMLAWFLVWLQMVIGVSGSGKVAYFTALFPYVVLLILLCGGATLEHAYAGVQYFYIPQWCKILKIKAWFSAVGQCFFSLGISFGGCVMFSSFNKFNHKLGRDILIISIMDTFTSLLAGTCLFMLLGNLSGGNNTTLKGLAENGGAGMAFVTFPAVLSAFGGAKWFISVMFFFMIMVLAVGSANGLVGTVVTVIGDAFPSVKRPIIVSSVCGVGFFLGLMYCCPSGVHVLDLVDRYGSEMVIYMVGVFESIGVIYVYGLKNISNDYEFMLGAPVNFYWIFSWMVIPIFLVVIFIIFLVQYTPIWMNEKEKIPHPPGATGFGWGLTVILWLIIPIAFVWVVQTRKSHLCNKRLKASFFPSRRWGPLDPTIREAWRRWKKTQPVEFQMTHRILVALHIRPNQPMIEWGSTAPLESQYQTENPSENPSETNLEGGDAPEGDPAAAPPAPPGGSPPPPPKVAAK